MSALLPTTEMPMKAGMSSRAGRAAKLIAVMLVMCGLLRLAYLDPLGFGPATASFLGNDRATITHVVMVKYKHEIGREAIDWTHDRMVELQLSCAHPYTGLLYIGGVDVGGPPEGYDHEHHQVFWFRFRSNAEKDYFVNQDPAYKALRKNAEDFVEKYTVLSIDDDKKEPA